MDDRQVPRDNRQRSQARAMLVHRGLLVTLDAALVSVAYLAAHWIRFEGRIPAPDVALMWQTLPLMSCTTVGALHLFGLYRQAWRYAEFADLRRVVSALSLGTLVAAALIFLLGLRGHSRLVFLAFYALAIVLIGFRVSARQLIKRPGHRTCLNERRVPSLIVGSGDTGEMVIREIHRNPALPYRPVGIVSGRLEEVGLHIHDVPVVGTIENLSAVISDLGVKEVVVADPELTGAEFKRIISLCAPLRIPVRVFPSPADVLGGKIEVSRIRNVQVEDLLRRKPVPPNATLMAGYLAGKRVLVTGAGGSIGSELCRQTCRSTPALLVMVDRVENSLYEIDLEIGERFPDLPRRAQLADIRCVPRMQELFEKYRPDIVFHAAAFKHVPLMEAHPGEVVLNNIVGTATLARLALDAGVTDFVLISSDKAVEPVNVMGVSKRVTELYMQHLANGPAKGRTKFVAVRFGNVLDSAGSLIPRLRRQIEQGGPVTVTHPQMTRYFMTIGEAVQLVIEAAAMSDGGEIFVLDMGEPVNIVDLVRDLITLSGLRPGCDIAITFTGLRPGEKLDEKLWADSEELHPTKNPKITAIRNGVHHAGVELDDVIQELEVLAEQGNAEAMIEVLRQIVPEFTPQLVEPAGGTTESVTRFRVLVADDDPSIRNLMSIVLRRAGMQVITAEDGIDARDRIKATRPHLVVLDIMMPRLDGLTLFAQLKAAPATRHLPVMLITAYPEVGEQAKGIEFDADDFISKPFRPREFVARVRNILRRRYRYVAEPPVSRPYAAPQMQAPNPALTRRRRDPEAIPDARATRGF